MRRVLARAPVVVAPERRMLARRCSAQSLTSTTTPAVWLQASFFSLAQAKYSSGDFKHTVFDSVDQAGCLACRGSNCRRCPATCLAVPSLASLCIRGSRQPTIGKRPSSMLSIHCPANQRQPTLLPAGVGQGAGQPGQRGRREAAPV